jgi:gas vesicle protein
MEENKSPNAGQGLGIAGLVLGIIALIISFIPCLGMWAIVPGIIAVILSGIGFSQASIANAKKGLIIAALVISLVGTAIAAWQFYIFRNAPDKLEEFGKEFQKAIEEELDAEDLEDLEEAMEALEGEIEEITDESIEEVVEAVTEAVEEITEEIKEAKEELDDDDE